MQASGPASPAQAQTGAAAAGGALETVTTAVGTQKPVLPVTESILQNRTYFLPLLVRLGPTHTRVRPRIDAM